MRSLFILAVFCVSGCGVAIPISRNESKLALISIGDSKEHVHSLIGHPDVTRAGSIESGGIRTMEQYELFKKSTPWLNAFLGPVFFTVPWWWPSYFEWQPGNVKRTYWLTYEDKSLVQYGMEGDWRADTTADHNNFIAAQKQLNEASLKDKKDLDECLIKAKNSKDKLVCIEISKMNKEGIDRRWQHNVRLNNQIQQEVRDEEIAADDRENVRRERVNQSLLLTPQYQPVYQNRVQQTDQHGQTHCFPGAYGSVSCYTNSNQETR